MQDSRLEKPAARDRAASARNPFHVAFDQHLDRCKQCHDHPFDLCHEGAILLRAAVILIKADGNLRPIEVVG